MELIVVRGTPQEIRDAFPGLEELLGGSALVAVSPRTHPEQQAEAAVGVPPHLHQYIAGRSRPPVRPLVERLVAALADDGAVFEIGSSQQSNDGLNRYFMVYPAGPRLLGAAAYVHPSNGRVDFRLSDSDLTDEDRSAGAGPRTVAGGHPYAVTLRLSSEADVEVARRLAVRALRVVTSGA